MDEPTQWSRTLNYNGKEYRIDFLRRPFREGLEVSVWLGDERVFQVAELGFGEVAVLERVRCELERCVGRLERELSAEDI